jgi:hypothetical protein
MSTAGRIFCIVRDTFFFDHKGAYVYLHRHSAVNSDWHIAGKFILLPDATTLGEVHRYVQSALAWREDPSSDGVENFTTRVDSLLIPQPFTD